MSASEEIVLEKAHTLAGARVLTHLERHQDVKTPRNWLEALTRSAFVARTDSSPWQYKALNEHLGVVLSWTNDWQDAARVVGWARRLCRWATSQQKRQR